MRSTPHWPPNAHWAESQSRCRTTTPATTSTPPPRRRFGVHRSQGRIAGAEDFTITLNEVLLGKNVPAAHRLVMVEVSPDGPEHDQLRYVAEHFRSINLGDLAATDVRLNWAKTWDRGTPPC